MSVVYDRNSFVASERESDLALLRCAQAADADGYPYFVIVQARRDAHAATTAELSAALAGIAATDTAAAGTLTRYNGRRFVSVKPANTNLMVTFTSPPDGFFYTSLDVIRDIKAKYGITD